MSKQSKVEADELLARLDTAFDCSGLILYANAASELRRLLELEARLPKTADGVPIMPGMEVHRKGCEASYVVPENIIACLPRYFGSRTLSIFVADTNEVAHSICNAESCYSTREAAIAAK